MSERINTSVPEVPFEQQALYHRVANFAAKEANQFASGAEIRQATGANQDIIMAHGGYEGLKKTATEFQAAQHEEALTEARYRVAQAAADQWTQERMAYRISRDVAKAQVEKQLEKTERELGAKVQKTAREIMGEMSAPRAAEISYGQRLKGLGARGDVIDPKAAAKRDMEAGWKARAEVAKQVSSDPKQQEAIRKAATEIVTGAADKDVRQAALEAVTAEGYSTTHLQPKRVEVVRNEAGEKRSSETVALLKEHDKNVAAGQLRAAAANQAPAAASAPTSKGSRRLSMSSLRDRFRRSKAEQTDDQTTQTGQKRFARTRGKLSALFEGSSPHVVDGAKPIAVKDASSPEPYKVDLVKRNVDPAEEAPLTPSQIDELNAMLDKEEEDERLAQQKGTAADPNHGNNTAPAPAAAAPNQTGNVISLNDKRNQKRSNSRWNTALLGLGGGAAAMAGHTEADRQALRDPRSKKSA